MQKRNILASISTKGRYDTTLSLAIASVVNQTMMPDKLIIFDDNENPRDVREQQHYLYLFQILSEKGVEWEWMYAEKKGQHYNHDKANHMGYKWVWRLDDDTVAESNVLETLYTFANTVPNVGAVAGSILTPPVPPVIVATGKIENIEEPNMQWGRISEVTEVDHLHCSFLYRAGVAEYCLGLSKVAHREETLFTYELKTKGYKNFVLPNAVVWHLKNKEGGIRDGAYEMYAHDEQIFRNKLSLGDCTPVVLDCGMGDHIVFKHVLPEIKNPMVFSCYPEILPGRSIAEAHQMLGSLDQYNIYAKMDQWNWTGSLEDAFRKLYVR